MRQRNMTKDIFKSVYTSIQELGKYLLYVIKIISCSLIMNSGFVKCHYKFPPKIHRLEIVKETWLSCTKHRILAKTRIIMLKMNMIFRWNSMFCVEIQINTGVPTVLICMVCAVHYIFSLWYPFKFWTIISF